MLRKEEIVAVKLVNSIRGQALVRRSLEMTIETLSKVKGRYREVSNIADIQLLLDRIFFIRKAQK